MLSLKTKKNLPKKDASLDIARDRKKTLKKGKEKRKMRKRHTAIINIFLPLFFLNRKLYVLLENISGKT